MFTRRLVGASGGDLLSVITSFNAQTENLQSRGIVKFVYAAKVNVQITQMSITTYVNGVQALSPSSYPTYYICQEVDFEPFGQ